MGHGEERADQLLANPKNWRIHPKRQQESLGHVLDRIGWVQSVIVNKRTGFLVDGHARVSAALDRNEVVPVVYVDLDEREEAEILASLDPLAAMAGSDKNKLGDLLTIAGVDDLAPALIEDLVGKKAHVGYTAGPDDDPVEDDDENSGPQQSERFPLAIVLTVDQHRKWIAAKESVSERNDSKALMKILDMVA